MQFIPRAFHYFIKKTHLFWEKYFKIHIIPAHYYSPIPVVSALDPEVFKKTFDCSGLEWNIAGQLDLLKNSFPRYIHDYTPIDNPGLSKTDAFILYSLIREKQPRLMVVS